MPISIITDEILRIARKYHLTLTELLVLGRVQATGFYNESSFDTARLLNISDSGVKHARISLTKKGLIKKVGRNANGYIYRVSPIITYDQGGAF